MKLNKILSALTLPIGLFLVNLVFMWFDLYRISRHTDSVFHIIGGIVSAHALWLLLNYFFKRQDISNPFLRRLLIFSLVGVIAVFWEFAEFGAEFFFSLKLQNGVADTMKDLALGMMGAVLYLKFQREK